MSAESRARSRENGTGIERAFKFGRDINAIGALAIAGVAVVTPGPNVILAGWAGLNAAQAGGFEILRQRAAKKKPKK